MIGDSLRAWRLAAGLTQSRAAWRLGVSRQYLHRVESGRLTPSLARVRELAALYGVANETVGAALTEAEKGVTGGGA